MADEGKLRKLSPGDVLFREGDTGDMMYLIRQGKIKIVKGRGEEEKVLAVLKEGDFFGEMAIIDGSPRSATAVAVDEVGLLTIDKETFHSKIRENPLISYVLETLSRRLRAADEQIKLLMIKSEERRVIALLLTRGKETGKKIDGGVEISPFSLEAFTNMVGIEFAKVKEFVDRLVSARLMSFEGDKLSIKSIADLEDYLRYITLKEKFERG
jgi:CRP-like cAMP-binding protein